MSIRFTWAGMDYIAGDDFAETRAARTPAGTVLECDGFDNGAPVGVRVSTSRHERISEARYADGIDYAKAVAGFGKTVDRFYEAQMRPLRLLALCGDLLAGRVSSAEFDERAAKMMAEVSP